MLLAIDTSTNDSGVALATEQRVLAECSWLSGRRHAEQVLPQIDLLLRHLDVEPVGLTAIAVAIGPGSWSGLRVGMSLAKALAVAHDLPLIGVPTLDVLAYPHRQRRAEAVVPLVRLGRDRYGAAVYRWLADGWRQAEPLRNLALDELRSFAAPLFVCGDVDEAARALLEQHYGAQAHVASGLENVRRPAALAEIAWQRLTRGELDDLVTLEPLYLGSPVKELTASGGGLGAAAGGSSGPQATT